MRQRLITLFSTACMLSAQSFEVATVKPTPEDWQGGRYLRMTGPQRFVATNYTPRVLIATAYSLNPRAVEGGPAWMDSEHFNTVAATPGEAQPTLDQQLSMVRGLLADRFKLAFHRVDREMPVYVLSLAKGGSKLQETSARLAEQPDIVSRIGPDEVRLPARNATMQQFAAVLQRSVFDRPMLDQTGLTGRYDFDLEWTPDETQFDGLRRALQESTEPTLFTALQEQLGLKLESTRALVSVIAIDRIERPSEN